MTTTRIEEVIEVLKGIEDPELFLDIYFLGLIYDIRVPGEKSKAESAEEGTVVEPGVVEIDMTFTTPMCPSGPDLIDQVKTGVEALETVDTTTVKVVFDPPWQPSEEVQAMMGML